MGIMTDRSPLIQQAYQDEPLGEAERDRLWSTMQHRSTRQARMRYLLLGGLLLLAGAIGAGLLIARNAVRSTSFFDRRVSGPVLVAADSLSSESPVEHTMIQEPAREEIPSNLIPLLGHRSSLRMDLNNFNARREELETRLNQTAGREHDRIATELASLESQIHSTQIALEVVDRQLAGHNAPLPAMPPMETITVEPPQFFTVPNPANGEMIAFVGGVGALLALGMVAVVGYIRRLSRTLKDALTQIEGQVSSQHATLASGIDAIAVEVERLGEGQRFMSKVLNPDPRAEVKR
jgi:hypothetical protein